MTGVFVDGKCDTIYGIHTDPSWAIDSSRCLPQPIVDPFCVCVTFHDFSLATLDLPAQSPAGSPLLGQRVENKEWFAKNAELKQARGVAMVQAVVSKYG